MITFVIFALTVGIALVAHVAGWLVFFLLHAVWNPEGFWALVAAATASSLAVGFGVQHTFRRRDSDVPIRWYEFSRDWLLGLGALLCFASGLQFADGDLLLGCAFIVAGFIATGYACIAGPWQTWEFYVGPGALLHKSKKRYPYPTPPHDGYEYEP
jgi:hypothetical protein